MLILRCDFIGGGAEIVTVNTSQHFREQRYGRIFNQLVRNGAVRRIFVFFCRDNADGIFASLADSDKLGDFFLGKAGFLYGKRNTRIGGKFGNAVIPASRFGTTCPSSATASFPAATKSLSSIAVKRAISRRTFPSPTRTKPGASRMSIMQSSASAERRKKR